MHKYKTTVNACFVGYIVQAIVNNFAPLLFLTFRSQYNIPLSQITLLITFNFLLQLFVDFISAFFIDKIGYRAGIIIAHVFSSLGLILMTVMPKIMQKPFIGLLFSVGCYAVGGGLLEVLVSPIVEACPTDNKEKAMSLLHSFYCWGCVGVVGISSLFFVLFGIENWKFLALLWAIIPLINAFVFTRVPIAKLVDNEKGLSILQLFKRRIFWVFMLMMVCSGASEQAVSQWASTFAEQALGVSKTLGDLTGPMMFSFLMGISRLLYGKFGDKISLDKMMLSSGILCIISYIVVSLSKSPVLGLIGVAMSGLSVGIMWPGTFSKASASIKGGGTAMFAFLALCGDLGCSSGPSFAGIMASMTGDNLKFGILCAIIFPVTLSIIVLLFDFFIYRKNHK